MIRLAALLLAFVLAVPGPAIAEEPAVAAERAIALDGLFDRLERAANDAAAREIEAEIRAVWWTAPDERSAFLMMVADERRRFGDKAGAVYALDELIRGYPDYAEAWNQRATVLFTQGNYDQSLRDIAECLAREPRHYAAMAGKAMIHLRRGEDEAAQETLLRATRINPWLPERRFLDPDRIERRL
jgi:tetratricopeptide (TPR) repeat protein